MAAHDVEGMDSEKVADSNFHNHYIYVRPDEEDGEGGAGEEGGGPAGASPWGWVACVDRASETMRCSWDAVWDKPAVEFLNVLAYRKDKDAAEKEALERWKRTH